MIRERRLGLSKLGVGFYYLIYIAKCKVNEKIANKNAIRTDGGHAVNNRE